ncbi:hypothetical protein EIP91_003884 [Steccherinum ochraceum]|uniref:Uncharacterized protein n=1 Tax=Steccherinum ochraceum TaxID=92696 RepID=A0A4R0RLA1_9APHY|nr:hypothetical protein EIP91_003884 [Steccherinum ochraceum]
MPDPNLHIELEGHGHFEAIETMSDVKVDNENERRARIRWVLEPHNWDIDCHVTQGAAIQDTLGAPEALTVGTSKRLQSEDDQRHQRAQCSAPNYNVDVVDWRSLQSDTSSLKLVRFPPGSDSLIDLRKPKIRCHGDKTVVEHVE